MALARSLLGERRSRCWRIQTSRSLMSGFARSSRIATRSTGVLPLTVRSISKRSSIRRTASAAIGETSTMSPVRRTSYER
jgi:hypothetical protein